MSTVKINFILLLSFPLKPKSNASQRFNMQHLFHAYQETFLQPLRLCTQNFKLSWSQSKLKLGKTKFDVGFDEEEEFLSLPVGFISK